MAVIEVDGLVTRYGDQLAVEDVSFTVRRGEIFGILGRNGAGKTTTVECLEGFGVRTQAGCGSSTSTPTTTRRSFAPARRPASAGPAPRQAAGP